MSEETNLTQDTQEALIEQGGTPAVPQGTQSAVPSGTQTPAVPQVPPIAPVDNKQEERLASAEKTIADMAAADAARQAEQATVKMNQYIFEQVKGEQNFRAMSSILKDNLKPDELAALNTLLGSGNKAQVDIALNTAVQKYNAIKGKGVLMQGDSQGAAQEPFTPLTKDEFYMIMRTEKYKTDPLYHKLIDARRLRTKQLDKKKYMPGEYWGQGQNGRYAL